MLLALSAAWAGTYTVDDALQHALRDNLELAGQRRGNAAVRYRLQLARSGFDPRLVASTNADRTSTPSNQATDVAGGNSVITTSGLSFSMGLSASLPTGGSVSASVSEWRSSTDSANAVSDSFVSTRAGVAVSQPLLRGAGFGAVADLRDAQLDSLAQELRWRAQVETLVLDVTGAYWGLLSARGALGIASRGVELAERQLQETLEREEAGFAGSGDVLQVRVALGQARRGEVNARADVGAAEQRLARVMGVSLDTAPAIELADAPVVPDVLPDREVLLARAREANADVLLARIEQERARREARRTRNGALPDLDLNANAGWSAGGTDPTTVHGDLLGNPAPSAGVGLTLGLPVLPRSTRATLGLAKLQLERADLALEAAEVDLVLAVDAAVRAVVRDAGGLEAARQTREHAVLSLAAQQELLSEGRGSTRDVVSALESLRSAEMAELDAQIALQSSVLRARRVAGDLVTPDQLE
ncbi:MAG: TolC family protein [Alphaproteobacteria bacterium]|nr:TolC family protein [Alphaproteobacteria bacterium]MCB9693578.1 TolC family protein [Alphaproteobacteria bacterium]